jgi:putative SOS response-associated peptidase YedK
MCGRFTLSTSPRKLKELLPLFEVPELQPRYNIAPTQAVAAARVTPERREVVLLRWGLIPSWADDPKIGNKLINARAETAAQKPSFRSAFRKRRCLVLADGFYEWKKTDGKKQPYHIRLHTGDPFAIAGLWEHWEQDGNVIESCTVLTTDANDLMRDLHDRMPVILQPDDFERWLDPGNQTGQGLQELLRPYPPGLLEAQPVDPRVNNPRNEDAGCIRPLAS